ncbi:MAG: hypothetical protein AABY27_07280 [Pseudomonadota bacterium]
MTRNLKIFNTTMEEVTDNNNSVKEENISETILTTKYLGVDSACLD